ncbi:MAG TPA: cytochrome c [Mucilaginibacter sp.]|jgi:mono/diheme cytochrome c family protein
MKSQVTAVAIILTSISLMIIFSTNAVMAQTKKWVAPAAARTVKNPVASTPSTIKDGKILYVTNCAPCHGNKGKGNGPAAAALTTKPADHTSAAVQSEKDGSLFWKISEGKKPMPQYKTILTATQRWELVSYIRRLAK